MCPQVDQVMRWPSETANARRIDAHIVSGQAQVDDHCRSEAPAQDVSRAAGSTVSTHPYSATSGPPLLPAVAPQRRVTRDAERADPQRWRAHCLKPGRVRGRGRSEASELG